MIEEIAKEAIQAGSRLSGSDLILYLLMLCQTGIIVYLLRINNNLGREIHENSKLLSAIMEQIRSLVHRALMDQGKNG